jgi:hypothetical protein
VSVKPSDVAVAWVRDLPNRIDIQIDGEAFGLAITESIRGELEADSSERQLNAIGYLSNGLAEGPETQTWIHTEYGDEIISLTDSADQEVATAASVLMESLRANAQPAANL